MCSGEASTSVSGTLTRQTVDVFGSSELCVSAHVIRDPPQYREVLPWATGFGVADGASSTDARAETRNSAPQLGEFRSGIVAVT